MNRVCSSSKCAFLYLSDFMKLVQDKKKNLNKLKEPHKNFSPNNFKHQGAPALFFFLTARQKTGQRKVTCSHCRSTNVDRLVIEGCSLRGYLSTLLNQSRRCRPPQVLKSACVCACACTLPKGTLMTASFSLLTCSAITENEKEPARGDNGATSVC